MRLKTKFQDEDFELGEVVDAIISTTSLVDTHIKLKTKAKRGGEHMFSFSRISELFELFEDYEEPKKHYEILAMGAVMEREDAEDEMFRNQGQREIGNYFETKEEAEQAVEKLKAWKRLKEVGFRFIDWELDMKTVADGKIWFDIGTNTEWDAERLLGLKPEIKKLLDMLFGGEE